MEPKSSSLRQPQDAAPAHRGAACPLTALPVIDYDHLERLERTRFRHAPDQIDEAIRLFLDGTPELVSIIDTATACDDYGAVQRIAQTLYGAADELGALRMAEAARALETCAQSAQPDLEAPATALRQAFFATIAALSAELRS